jgi:hypothetical protein
LSNPLQGKGAESGDQGKAGQDGRAAAGRGGGSTGGGLVASGRGDDASAGANRASGSGLGGSRADGSRAGGSAGDGGALGSGGLSSRSLGSRGLLGRGGLLGGSGVGGRGRARARVGGAESLSGGQDLVDGNVSAALLDDTAGSLGLDNVEVLADADVVGGRALGVGSDGGVEAGQSARGDIGASLSLGQSGEGKGNERVLHLVGIKGFGGVLVVFL